MSRLLRDNGRNPAPVYWMRSTGRLRGEIRRVRGAGFQLFSGSLVARKRRLLLPFNAVAGLLSEDYSKAGTAESSGAKTRSQASAKTPEGTGAVSRGG